MAADRRRGDVGTIGREDELSIASSPDRNRHPHGDNPLIIYDHAALRLSGSITLKSATRLVSPGGRGGMPALRVLMSPRSTRNCTMRVCSTENSSPQSGWSRSK